MSNKAPKPDGGGVILAATIGAAFWAGLALGLLI